MMLIETPNDPFPSDVMVNGMGASSEFSYSTFLRYNAMFTELLRLQPMHFRQLREFIPCFVRSYGDNRTAMLFIEPMLITNVIAALDSETFGIWKNEMVGKRASLRSIREFLARREELASDHWFRSSRFTLAAAV